MKKGELYRVNKELPCMIAAGDKSVSGDRVIVLKPRDYEGATLCEVYNQRAQQRHWIFKEHIDVLS